MTVVALSLPQTEIVTVTPAIAEQYLAHNHKNRALKRRVIATYVRDMRAGEWQLTGEAIKFDRDGNLMDGQHRLHAVVESGATVQMLVVTGLAPEAQMVMDSGAGRSGADVMSLLGEKYTANMAATIRLAILYLGGDLTTKGSKRQVSRSEQVDFLRANPELRTYVELSTVYRKTIAIPASSIAVALWVLGSLDQAVAAQFFEDLSSLTGLESGDSVLALQSRLTEILRARRRVEAAEYLSMIFRAWNARREGRKLHKLPMEYRGGVVTMPTPH